MLQDLVVEGLGVFERAEVRLPAGATVITGETGAGKTLVISALSLLLGDRADRNVIRAGSERARVEGRFVIPAHHPAVGTLEDLGAVDDGSGDPVEVVVSREISRDSSRARINGRLVTLTALGEVVRGLVEIAGQNEHQRLSAAGSQRRMLDRFAGSEATNLAGEVTMLFGEATQALATAQELAASERERSREIDVLKSEIAEISAANVVEGEWARLTAEARRLENAAEIGAGSRDAIDAIREEGGAEDGLLKAENAVRALAAFDPEAGNLADRLERARIDVSDVASELSSWSMDAEPSALADTRDRLDVLSKIKRKYGDDEVAVLAYLKDAERRLDELQSDDSRSEQWRRRGESLMEQAAEKADRLSAIRNEAAAALGRMVEERLAKLAMPGAAFRVVLERHELASTGNESVTFEASANSGEPPRPIAKAVSGGELSRIALALHLAASSGDACLLVFDEVDAGVGGKAALEVGRALSSLADSSGVQVLVVTHLPQVAAFADSHLRVVKRDDGTRSTASLERVETDGRVDELSRMLAGMPESEGGRRHAEELLALAAKGAGNDS